MDVLDNKCPACGAKITFNPKNQMWDCKYCGSKFSLEEMKKHNNASSEKANSKENKKKAIKKLDGVDVYRCKNCGAEIMADETTTATFCVYCGSTAILKDKIDEGLSPNLIIPFKNVKEDAIEAFKKVTKHKPLMPKAFKEERNIQKITGVYIPFWAYDISADGQMEFSATDIRTWSDYNYHYTETSRYLVTQSGHFDYEKVLADASSRFPDDLMDSLEPFHYKDLTDYNHAYLSGFLAEKYDVSEEDGFERAKNRSINTCVDMMSSNVRHQTKIVKTNNMEVKKEKTNYIMLPVWMVNIHYNGKMYTFAMNGQTGKIVGNIPVSVGKTIAWSVSLFIGIFSLLFLFVWFIR